MGVFHDLGGQSLNTAAVSDAERGSDDSLDEEGSTGTS